MPEKDAECPGGISMSMMNRRGALLVTTTRFAARIRHIARDARHVLAAATHCAPLAQLHPFLHGIALHQWVLAMSTLAPVHAWAAVSLDARIPRQPGRPSLFPQYR